MDKITVTIDGQKIEATSGMTILQVALSAGIHIPTLCHDPRLPALGACRICVVDVEGSRGAQLVASCSAPAADGMVVTTNNPRIHAARKMTLELILSDHPNDCMACEANGDCKLQDLVYEYQIETPLFAKDKFDERLDTSSPVIILDRNKCILCGRCVRGCNEIQVHGILNFMERGADKRLIAGLDQPYVDSGCVSCGECVSLCPVGALTEKMSRFKGRPWELRSVPTICNYCGVGCFLYLNVADNQIVRVKSDPEKGVNRGALCVKGRFGYDFVNSEERLKTPLIKENGFFRETTWDEALDLVADKLTAIKNQFGSDALATLASAKATNEENYLMQKFTRAVLGTNNVDHCARLCHSSTVAGLAAAFGSGAMTNSINEIEGADVIFVIGSNTTESHPVIGSAIKRAAFYGDTKLIVADPRFIELAKYATIYIQHPCGTDIALLNGMMNVIIAEDLYDKKFVQSCTEGFEELKAAVEKYTPEYVQKITSVPADDIRKAARMYANAENAMIFYAMGITQHTKGTDNVKSIANLAMLTGNIGKPNSGVNPLRGQGNVQGACDMGALPDVFPGYQSLTDLNIRAKFESAWGVKLPPKVGLTVVEMMNAAYEGKIKGMYIMGENPMLSDPDINHVEEALENLDFLVVQDIFLSETAQLADVVLPAVTFAEKDGTYTNTERRVQLMHKAIGPIGNARTDSDIICDLATRMGYEMHYESSEKIMAEVASLTPIYGGIYHDRLGEVGLQWPCRDREDPGTPYLHKGQFTKGLGKFHAIDFIEAVEKPDEEYPYTLTTGRMLYHWHTGTMTRRAKALNEIVPEGYAEISLDDAAALGILPGDEVKITSRRGEVVVKAKVTKIVPPKTVFMPFHFRESAANVLTIAALDPISKIPEYKVCAVKIEKF